jgi:hypothetical protein
MYNNVSGLYIKLKELRLARKFAEKAHAILLKVLGPKDSHTIRVSNNLEGILEMEKDPEFASEIFSDSRLCSTCNKVWRLSLICSSDLSFQGGTKEHRSAELIKST